MPRLRQNDRERAVGMVQTGMTHQAVADHFNVSTMTISRLMIRLRQIGRTNDRPHSRVWRHNVKIEIYVLFTSAQNCSRNIECRKIQRWYSWSYRSALSATAKLWSRLSTWQCKMSRGSCLSRLSEPESHPCSSLAGIITGSVTNWTFIWTFKKKSSFFNAVFFFGAKWPSL